MDKFHNKYNKIRDFKSVVQHIKNLTRVVGKDDNGKIIYDPLIPLPTLTFDRGCKLHGTNGQITQDIESLDWWPGARKNIISAEPGKKDNAGMAGWMDIRVDDVENLLHDAKLIYMTAEDEGQGYITLHGEFAGGNIQKGMAITGRDKFFSVFEIEINGRTYFPEPGLTDGYDDFFNVNDYSVYKMEIDFNDPLRYQNVLIEETLKCEDQCEAGTFFGLEGIGEGHVYTTMYKGERLRFKCKGEKHSTTNTKTLIPVDIEKLESIDAFVEFAYTEARYTQCANELFESDPTKASTKDTGKFIGWMNRDVWEEEKETLVKSGLTMKDVNHAANTKNREWLFKFIDSGL